MPLAVAVGQTTGTSPLVVSAAPSSIYEIVTSNSGTTADFFTLTISGGTAPYTAEWTSDLGAISPTTPTSTTSSTFDFSLMFPDTEKIATITITVTDSLAQTKSVYYGVTLFREPT